MADLNQGYYENNVDLLIRVRSNSGWENKKENGEVKKGAFIQIERFQADLDPKKVAEGKQRGEANPYLISIKKSFTPQGQTEPTEFTSHESSYSAEQLAKIFEAGASTKLEREEKDGIKVSYYNIKASIFESPNVGKDLNGNVVPGLVIDTKRYELRPGIQLTPELIDKQAEVTQAAREYRNYRIKQKGVEQYEAKHKDNSKEVSGPELEI